MKLLEFDLSTIHSTKKIKKGFSSRFNRISLNINSWTIINGYNLVTRIGYELDWMAFGIWIYMKLVKVQLVILEQCMFKLFGAPMPPKKLIFPHWTTMWHNMEHILYLNNFSIPLTNRFVYLEQNKLRIPMNIWLHVLQMCIAMYFTLFFTPSFGKSLITFW